jgi:hypothetical protein
MFSKNFVAEWIDLNLKGDFKSRPFQAKVKAAYA